MVTTSIQETKLFARNFAKDFQTKGGIIFLKGVLGSGKTTFTQGFAQGLGIKDKIISPTFVLTRQHNISPNKTLFHIDLYRLNPDTNPREIGLLDMITNKQNIILIEWPERLKDPPKNALIIEFKILSPESREINVI